MARRNVPPDNGKFKIKAKEIQGMGSLDLGVEFVNKDNAGKHIVEEITGDEVTAKKPNQPSLPTTWNNQAITWFVNFNVYQKKADGTKGNYASVDYEVSLTLPQGKS